MRRFFTSLCCLFLVAGLVAPVTLSASLPGLDGPSLAQAASKKSAAPKTQSVKGYTKKDGTKVAPYKRSKGK